MQCYAIGLLRSVRMGPDIVAYLEAIDATLAPYHGRFLIHGGEKHMLEGTFDADVIVIAFPDRASAEAWYRSPAYRQILGLRTANAEGMVFLIDGVDATHKATDILSR
ncbi:MAG: DUF1330 domain-containing protein [Hoeflea sp.]|nr:DUF1330 domain-containing protein [Hoeflea sp.]